MSVDKRREIKFDCFHSQGDINEDNMDEVILAFCMSIALKMSLILLKQLPKCLISRTHTTIHV